MASPFFYRIIQLQYNYKPSQKCRSRPRTRRGPAAELAAGHEKAQHTRE